MTRSTLIARALALAALLPCVSVITSSNAAAHPYAGGRAHYSRVAAPSWGGFKVRRVMRVRIRFAK